MGETNSINVFPPRDHGGGVEAAAARFGGAPEDWLDLSTGINPLAYPVPPLAPLVWSRLPEVGAMRRLEAVARQAYGVPETADVVAAPGAQALIQLAPRLRAPARCAIRAPTYNEHAAAFRGEGWAVRDVSGVDPSTEAVVVVTPNNPDGRPATRDETVAALARGSFVLLDESFADAAPELSLADLAGRENLLILRSFGKFYGLAGLRLGFALAPPADAARLRAMLGPWAVAGPALAIGAAALADAEWAAATRARLRRDAARLRALLAAAGFAPVGGTPLFHLVRHPDAAAAFERLARRRILTRPFPYDATWLRFGLPGAEEEWRRLEDALAAAA